MIYLEKAAQIVTPFVLLMLTGYALKRLHILECEALKGLNALTYKVLLPLLVFKNIASADLHEIFNARLVLLTVVCILVEFALSALALKKTAMTSARKATLVQSMSRSNFVIFGVTIAASVYGKEAAGLPTLLIAVVIPLNAILAAAVFAYYCDTGLRRGQLALKILTNPNTVAAALGVLLLWSGLRVPALVQGVIDDLGGMASTLALLTLGASFSFSNVRRDARLLSLVCLVRLIAAPALGVALGYLLRLRGMEALTLFAVCGSPTAIASFSTAAQLGGDAELAGETVMATSLCCVLTIFLWIVALGATGILGSI